MYLTARDVNRGQEAVAKLNQLGLKPSFHQLEITDESSITKFRDHLVQNHGGIDILINNAAIAFKVGPHVKINLIFTNPLPENCNRTFQRASRNY